MKLLKKFLLLLIFGMFSFSFQAQSIVYVVKSGDHIFDENNCFKKNSNYNGMKLDVIKGNVAEIAEFTMVISLSPEKTYTFNSYAELENVDALKWLQDNDAFKNFKKLKVEIKTRLTNGMNVNQEFDICIEKDQLTRSLTKPKTKEPFIRVPVWFATDRNDTGDTDLNDRFGNKRSDLKYGMCEVSIPNIHKVGEIESPVWWKFEFSEDPKKHMVIQKIQLKDKDSYFKEMSEMINKSSEKSSFLFVHGYNVSFEAAAKRTAQITYDLHFDGEAVFYSWPSKGVTAAYTMDEATIQWSQYNMKHFLEDYLTKTTAENVYLVAHSMGNRGLTRALNELMLEKPELNKKIKEVILAAPDIDAGVFKRDIAPKMVERIKKPITLYVSADDVALQASHKVHGNPRAGDAGQGLVLVPGIETIDASGVDTSFLSHSYFADTHTIIEDILEMIKSGRRAAYRETLKLIQSAGKQYWKVLARQ